MIPKAAEFVKSIFAKKPFPYGTAIGEGLMPFAAGIAFGRKIPGAGAQYLSGVQQQSYSATGALPGEMKINNIFDTLGKLGWIKRK